MAIERDILLRSSTRIEHDWPANYTAADAEDFEGGRVYDTYDSCLKHIGKARVSPDSVIYKKGLLIGESLYSQGQKPYYRFRHLAKKVVTGKRVTLNACSNYLLATDTESAGHFHWLTEVLPRLWGIKEKAGEFVLLLPDRPYIRNIGLESLGLLDLKFDDIVLMKEDEFYSANSLYFITKVSRSGQMHPEVMRALHLAFTGGKPGGDRRIYFSRTRALRRKVLNEQAVEEILKNYGFEIFFGEDLGLAEQIDIFSSCGTLMGIHGAGLTNCLFMKRGRIVELKKKEPNHGYWHLADSLGHNYYYYNGIPDSEASLIGQGCNLTVSPRDLEERILNKL